MTAARCRSAATLHSAYGGISSELRLLRELPSVLRPSFHLAANLTTLLFIRSPSGDESVGAEFLPGHKVFKMANRGTSPCHTGICPDMGVSRYMSSETLHDCQTTRHVVQFYEERGVHR
jgi:hypothetical protein